MSFTRFPSPRTLILKESISMTIYIKPTVLYILQHSITGLKYFGKTTQDISKYKGSGVYWTSHIKKHGKEHVVTLWVSDPYIDSDAIVEFALSFSEEHNIVKSKDWANIKPENGLDGGGATGPRGPYKKQRTPSGRRGPNGRRGIPTGLSPKKGKPSGQIPWNKGKTIGPNKSRGVPRGPNKGRGTPHGPQAKVTCPHCGKIGGVGNMKRWHFDKCPKKSMLPGLSHILGQPAQ
jgi:hypothetical protein